MEDTRPRIRTGLDFFSVQHEGQQMICLRDPLQIAADPILVPPHAFFVLALMDGSHNLPEIRTAFQNRFGQEIPAHQIQELADLLDEKMFMDSSLFRDRFAAVSAEFRNSSLRPSALAGQAYPSDREEVRSFLGGLFESLPRIQGPTSDRLAGIVAPHIDLHRGGALFAQAFGALRDIPPPHTVLILGTAHFGDGSLYTLCSKDFETPLGISRADRDFAKVLLEDCPFDLQENQLAHRSEHSIEFQVLFLQYLFMEEEHPLIVPVLCGGLEDYVEPGASPMTHPEVRAFTGAVEKAVDRCPRPVLIVSGADLSHVGRKFGMDQSITPAFLSQVRKDDQCVLEAGIKSGGEAFYTEVARIDNRNNICSVTSIYTLQMLLKNCRGEILAYDQAQEPDTDSAVGFAALNFWESS